jgi:hypothetical protein
MNLRDIHNILSKIDFSNTKLGLGNVANNRFSVTNLRRFKAFLETVRPLGLFEVEIQRLFNSELYQTSLDSIETDGPARGALFDWATIIHNGLGSLFLLLSKILPQIDDNSINIKLPDPDDFETAISFQKDIFTAISQNVLNDEIKGKVILTEWEPGSFWLNLYLGSVAAVTLVGGMAWSAAVVFKKYQEGKILEKSAESMDIQNEALKELKRGVARSVDLILKREAKSLQVQNFKDHTDNEQTTRLQMGIEKFMGLIGKGAEIHPALKAPESVKNLFPDFTKLSLIETRTKLIEDKKPDGPPQNESQS